MKTALAILMLVLPAFGAGSPAGSEKAVLATIDTWKQAMLRGDAATLEKIYHKDLAYTHSSGKVETKAEAIANATKASAIAKAIDIHELTSHVYGNTATVKGKIDFTNGQGVTSHLDVLMVS